MSPDELFLHRYGELKRIDENPGPMAYLDASAILRQLLIDGTPLVDLVNRRFKLKVSFHVVEIDMKEILSSMPPGLQPFSYMSFIDLIYPGTVPTDRGTPLNRDQFLRMVVDVVDEHHLTVRDVIQYAANNAGGVHFDPPASTDLPRSALHRQSSSLQVGGAPVGIRTLRPIIKIVIEALDPLCKAIQA